MVCVEEGCRGIAMGIATRMFGGFGDVGSSDGWRRGERLPRSNPLRGGLSSTDEGELESWL